MRISMIDPSAFTIPYDVHLSQAIARQGIDVSFLTRPIRQIDYYSEQSESTISGTGGCHTVEHFYRFTERFPFPSHFASLKSPFKGIEHALDMVRLKRTVHKLRSDVIHFQWIPVPVIDRFLLPQLKSLAPLVLTVHDADAFLAPSSPLQTYGWRAALNTFDGLIVHTQAGKRALIDKGLSSSKIHIVPHGILRTPHAPKQLPELSATFPAKPKLFTVLAFGSIKPYKGLDILIRALAMMPSHLRSNIRVIIAGNPTGSLGVELQQLAASIGVDEVISWHLRFIGDSEIAELFSQADAVTFPYRKIDASGALMTALPFGKTIVASRLGLFEELLIDGETAYLVEPSNPSALADALIRASSNRSIAAKIGKRAAKVASEVCSWEGIADMTVAIYRNLQGR